MTRIPAATKATIVHRPTARGFLMTISESSALLEPGRVAAT
jgi:hypothetical protein